MKAATRRNPLVLGGAAGCLLAAGFLAGRLSVPFSSLGPAAVASPVARPVALAIPAGREAAGAAPEEKAAEAASRAAWEKRWRDLLAQPAGAAREKAMAEALRELAVTDPGRALALAKQEVNFRARQALLGAALSGWATVEPNGPLNWAVDNLYDAERRNAVETIIAAGSAAKRDETIQAINALCAKDTAMADDYGRMLIASLAGNSDFEAAMNFATASTTVHRDYWLSAAFYSWSQYRPQEAARALKKITDPAAYNEAVHGLILGWSSNDPSSLVAFADQLPAGPVRSEAYNQALQNWVTHDPVAASAWLDARGSTPELDSGAVKLATSPFLVANNLETALSWAASVSDPQQRTIALVDLIQQWAQRDPAAARRYAESLPDTDLMPDYRSMLMKDLAGTGAVATAAPP